MTDDDPHRLRTTGHNSTTRAEYVAWHRQQIATAQAVIGMLGDENHPAVTQGHITNTRIIEHHQACIARLQYQSAYITTDPTVRRSRALARRRKENP